MRRGWPSHRSSTTRTTMTSTRRMTSQSSKWVEVSPVPRTRSTPPVCPALRWVPTFLLTLNWDIMMQRYTYIDWQDTIVSGWGTLSFLGSFPDVLQWVKVPPLSDATCNQPSSYNGQITANMICAGLNNCFHYIFVYICTVYNYFCLHLYSL